MLALRSFPVGEAEELDGWTAYRVWWTGVPNRVAAKTARLWRYYVLRTFADLGSHPLAVQPVTLNRYLEQFRTQHANAIRLALYDFFTQLQAQGLRADHPLESLRPRQRGRTKIRRSLSEDELRRLLIALCYLPPRFPWRGQRVAWLALGQYLTGCRPSELLNLTTDRIHLNGRSSHLEIIDTKTDDDRIVPLGSAARLVFNELTDGRHGRIAAIGTARYYELINRAARFAGIPPDKARPYALRHTFATHLLDRGASERLVADLLGHRDLRHIWGYTIPADDDRRRAVDLLG